MLFIRLLAYFINSNCRFIVVIDTETVNCIKLSVLPFHIESIEPEHKGIFMAAIFIVAYNMR